MHRENGDLVREATMARVRQHVRVASESGVDEKELEDEVVQTYELNHVETGLARIMITYYANVARSRQKRERADGGTAAKGAKARKAPRS
jgi:hypothetical protein